MALKTWVRADRTRNPRVGVYLHTTSNWNGEYHAHDDKIQWVMPVQPGYGLISGKKSENIPSDSILLIPPDTEHSHITGENPKVILVSLAKRVWDDIVTSWVDDGGQAPLLGQVETTFSNELQKLITQIHQTAIQGTEPGASLLLEALSTQLAICWLRKNVKDEPKFLHEEAIHRLCDSLREDIRSEWSIDRMCQLISLSPSQLLRCFKDVMNTTPYKHLVRLRVDLAVEQLSKTQKPIEVVAHDCGFGSRRGLEVAVKAQYGLSPSEFRR